MGIYDRDYMLEKKPEKMQPAKGSVYERPVKDRAPWWARLKFRLWLMFHRRG